MKTVESSGQAEVGAVVHDELDARSQPRPEFTSLLEHAPGVSRLVAVLQQCAARGGEFIGRSKHRPGVWKQRGVENRVQPGKLIHVLINERSWLTTYLPQHASQIQCSPGSMYR